MREVRYCQWVGCREFALDDPVARGRVPLSPRGPAGSGPALEVDLYLCAGHRDALAAGSAAEVSIAVEPKPSRPA